MYKRNKILSFMNWLMPICLYADAGGGGSGDGTGGGQQQQQQAAPVDLRTFIKEDGALNPGWAKALGGNEAWESKYTSLKSLLGSHASLETMMGRDKLVVPTEHSSADEWNAFYTKLGRPEKADGYGIKRPDGVPDGIWDDKLVAGFQAKAHELGLTPKQASALVAWQLGTTQEAVKAAEAQATQAREQTVTALKTEWGADYETKLVAAKQAAIAVGGDALLNNPKFSSDPDFIKVMAKVGEMIGEKGNLPGGRDVQSGFNGDPKAEIARIYADPKHPYFDATHPGHAQAMKDVQALFAKAYQG